MFEDKYIIRFVVCSRVTESRDIAFAWEEIRTQADHVLSDNIYHETETSPHKQQHGVAKEEITINNGIGSEMKRTHDDDSENYLLTKKSRFMHADMNLCMEVSKETPPSNSNGLTMLRTNNNDVKMLPNSINAVTLIQDEAFVLEKGSIKEVTKKMTNGAVTNALTKTLLQQVLHGTAGNDRDLFE